MLIGTQSRYSDHDERGGEYWQQIRKLEKQKETTLANARVREEARIAILQLVGILPHILNLSCLKPGHGKTLVRMVLVEKNVGTRTLILAKIKQLEHC